MNKKRLVSGITSTGKLTLGNYIGAIQNFVQLQDKYEMLIFVADLHALTIDIEPEVLKNNKKNIMATYIAAGLNPEKTTLFYQSDVEAHGQMAWIMESRTTIGELSRMTQFKDKSNFSTKLNNNSKIKTGLLTYPTLMAGDILLYNPTIVPTGHDQKQHIELTRNIATRFNNQFGQTFIIPKPFSPKIGAKIMSLTDPTKKMSKSSKIPKSYILLSDPPEIAAKKIMKAVTDSENKVYISDNKPGIKNLLTIYAALKKITLEEAEIKFKDSENYGILKIAVANIVKKFLTNLQSKYQEALSIVDKVAIQGAKKAKLIANETLKTTKEKLGL